MKNNLLTLVFIGFSALLSAQSAFTLKPNPSDEIAPAEEYDVSVHMDIKNITNDTLPIKWIRKVITISPGCSTQVCDPNYCYLPTIDSRKFDMDPLDVDTLIIHFLDDTISQCAGIVHLELTNLKNPSDIKTAVFTLNLNLINTVDAYLSPELKVFPNPVVDGFALANAEGAHRLRVYSLDGRIAAEFAAGQDNFYMINSLPTGTYILSVENEKGQLLNVLEIHKS